MHISKIAIENFRNFKSQEITFNDGVNVIIGHNNAGKTNLIKALSLIFDGKGIKRLEIDDFNKHTSLEELKEAPPKIIISITISQGKYQENNDLVTIANWLTKLEEPYEALLTYEFFLPKTKEDDYLKAVSGISDLEKIWKIIQQDFIRFFVYKIWGGNIIIRAIADSESLQKFDFQFLNAIRDVERDMLTGRNTLLRDVLDFFMDYDTKKSDKSNDEKTEEIKKKKEQFSADADHLVSELQKRMEKGKEQILSYARDTGASFNKATPNFDGIVKFL